MYFGSLLTDPDSVHRQDQSALETKPDKNSDSGDGSGCGVETQTVGMEVGEIETESVEEGFGKGIGFGRRVWMVLVCSMVY